MGKEARIKAIIRWACSYVENKETSKEIENFRWKQTFEFCQE